MQKITQRQIAFLLHSAKQQDRIYQKLLKSELFQNHSLKHIFQYCLQIFNKITDQKQQKPEAFSDFGESSPKQISKMILKTELKKIEQQFEKLPQKSSKIQHFLLILIKVMNFKFQNIPQYLIGIVDMFKKIKNRQTNKLKFQDFQTYVVGQLTNLHQQEQNTQFQVHFQQKKKQDYLIHDSGIQKIYYSKDLLIYLVLDQNSQTLKIYNSQMRVISRFIASKLNHNNSTPKIKYFDFNELDCKIGLILSDSTFEIINLKTYLHESRQKFQNSPSNDIVFQLPERMITLQFIQMTNKWIMISESNKVYLLNPEKSNQNEIDYLKEIKIFNDPKEEMKIIKIIELVTISSIGFVAGNQIYFFNENLTEKKFRNYKHGSKIKNLKYSEEKNKLYVQGDQKKLIILSIEKNASSFRLSQYNLDFHICNFQIFPLFETILITDSQHNVFLYDTKYIFCYQMKSYSHIAKKGDNCIKILKTSKNEFLIYHSYIISMFQQKVAIQKQVQYIIDPITYFDQSKQQIYLSVNNQIININILAGQIRKNFNSNQYDLPKYQKFFMDEKFNIIIFDNEMNLFYLNKKSNNNNNNSNSNENKKYRNFQLNQVKEIGYDYQNKLVYVLSNNELFQTKEENKLFNLKRHLILQDFGDIIISNFNYDHKKLFITTYDNYFYLINLNDFSLEQKIKIDFPKDKKILQEKTYSSVTYIHEYQAIIVLSNNNQLFIFSVIDPNIQLYIDLLEGVTYKKIDLGFKFIKMVVEVNKKNNIKKKNNNKAQIKVQVMLATEDGHFLQIDITQILNNQFLLTEQNLRTSKTIATIINKNKYNLKNPSILTILCSLNTNKKYSLSIQNSLFLKKHNKQIIIMRKIFIQKDLTLTVAKDGQIKLQQKNKMICIASLPNINIKQSNMKQIQELKFIKTSKQIKSLIESLYSHFKKKDSPQKLLFKVRKSKPKQGQPSKINYNRPISIQIQDKNIQDIVNKQFFYQTDAWKKQQYSSILFRTQKSRFKSKLTKQQQLKKHSPSWKDKKQFQQILLTATSKDKYSKHIPKQLLSLRRSLDIFPKTNKLNPEQIASKIIPQLSSYQFQPINKNNINEQQGSSILDQSKDNFESCYFIKSQRKVKKTNINDFDQIDKEFYKKNMNIVKRFIPRKNDEHETFQTKLSKSLYIKKEKHQQNSIDHKKNLHKNAITNIIELFEKHNKEVAGTKNNRQIRISRQTKALQKINFHSRY